MRVKTSYKKGEGITLHLCEIYCNTVLETSEGNQVAICMRDDTIEFNIINHHPCWYRINMQTGEVFPMNMEPANAADAETNTESAQSVECTCVPVHTPPEAFIHGNLFLVRDNCPVHFGTLRQ